MRIRLLAAFILTFAAARSAGAQIVVYEKGDQRVTLGGTVEPEYLLQTADGDATTDHAFLRRLIIDTQATLSSSWTGVIQLDFGQSTITIRNALVQYTRWRPRGITLTIGNQKFPFSRSFLTSGTRRQNPERPFTGDRNYGTLNRVLGIRLDGANAGRRVQWSAALGSATQLVGARQVTFDTPAAHDTPTLTEGTVTAGRIEWHPLGETPKDQGDFNTPHWRTVLAGAAYRWWNDSDRQTATGPDLAHVRGLEISSGLRGHRVSLDAELERVDSVAKDPRLSSGIYQSGQARLTKGSLEGGYMIVNHRFELVGSFDALDAAGYVHSWRRTQVGGAWYLRDHNVKLELSHRVNAHTNGGPTGLHETFAQLQLVF